MSRSGYSDDCENVQLYRQAVDRATKGKRGQAFLRELRDRLIELPVKELTAGELADPIKKTVCALGAALVPRLEGKVDDPYDTAAQMTPDYGDSHNLAMKLGIARSLVNEIQFHNDDDWSMRNETPEHRYRRMLDWIKGLITS